MRRADLSKSETVVNRRQSINGITILGVPWLVLVISLAVLNLSSRWMMTSVAQATKSYGVTTDLAQWVVATTAWQMAVVVLVTFALWRWRPLDAGLKKLDEMIREAV